MLECIQTDANMEDILGNTFYGRGPSSLPVPVLVQRPLIQVFDGLSELKTGTDTQRYHLKRIFKIGPNVFLTRASYFQFDRSLERQVGHDMDGKLRTCDHGRQFKDIANGGTRCWSLF